MSVTIKDIARELNLNFSSVSRALNSKAGVSEKTRQIVLQKAEELGYYPNVLARGLVSRSTKTIGVIMPDIINPVFGAITTGIIETAYANDYDVFICITNWSEQKEKDYIHTILEKQVAGILVKTVSDSNSQLLNCSNIPIVGYESETSPLSYSTVSTNNEKAGYIAGEHLAAKGYTRPAVLPGPEYSSAAIIRSRGFYRACSDFGIEVDESRMRYGDYNIQSGYNLAAGIINDFPDTDSILAGNDVIALGILQYMKEHNIHEGKDIGVIGFDNISFTGLPQINLTTVKQQKYRIGRIMTNLLFEEMKNTENNIKNLPRMVQLDPELIVRGTTLR
jgi:LacI family transcriptional regulator